MRKIAHLSDIHVGGPFLRPAAQALLEDLHVLRPDLIAISGDLTQRARVSEFEKVAKILRELPAPIIVVPGNHDLPINIFLRWSKPFARYKSYISRELRVAYEDEEVCLVGLCSSYGGRWIGGLLGKEDIAWALKRLSGSQSRFKLFMLHHPLTSGAPHAPHKPLPGARKLLGDLAGVGADLVLAGHLHVARLDTPPAPAPGVLYSASVTSQRSRGTPKMNAYNFITLNDQIFIEQRGLSNGTFQTFGKFTLPGGYSRSA